MIYKMCFDPNGFTAWIVWPCLVSTGLVSGALIHTFLKPVILGVPGIAWQYLGLSVLGAAGASTYALYSTSVRTDVRWALSRV